MVKRGATTPAEVAEAAEALTAAQTAVEQLFAHSYHHSRPSLRTIELRLIAEQVGELRRQVLEVFGP